MELTKEEFSLFREFIERRCGIYLGDDKAYLVKHRLARLVTRFECHSYKSLLDLAVKPSMFSDIAAEIIDAISTNETSWFRDPKQFDILQHQVIPKLWEKLNGGRRSSIDIWSAGCSTGQEPYSIAMTLNQFLQSVNADPTSFDRVNILATDISKKALETGRQGQYDEQAMNRGLTTDYVRRFFQRRDRVWQVNEDLKQAVSFKEYNLKDTPRGLGVFDVIFLRNVIIYFSDHFKKELLSRIGRCLTQDGYLFLGTGETLSGYTSHFKLEEIAGVIFYRLK